MVTITLKGREIPLLYTTWEMKQVQEELGPISTAIKKVLGRNPEDENDMSLYAGAEHLAAAATLIRILGNAGLEESGEAADLTDKKVLRALKPADLAEAVNKCMDAMAEGMKSEIPEKKQEGPVDVTLEEMNKKKEKES
jgi:hypothetical protein